ncbi:MAG TPA: hypothetical protein V6C65_08265, partial [Allocoleopsis sp.]
YTEVRVTWIPVPVGTTPKQVEAKLAKLPQARLVRILSLKTILTEEQKRSMDTGVNKLTEEDYAERCVLTRNEDGTPGVPALYKGHQQYRRIVFNDGLKGAMEDIDIREQDKLDIEPVNMTSTKTTAKEAFKG